MFPILLVHIPGLIVVLCARVLGLQIKFNGKQYATLGPNGTRGHNEKLPTGVSFRKGLPETAAQGAGRSSLLELHGLKTIYCDVIWLA